MDKKLLPGALQDNKLIHILGKANHMFDDPLVDIAIKFVVDASPAGNIKFAKNAYEIGGSS
jgi:hypothetical protein